MIEFGHQILTRKKGFRDLYFPRSSFHEGCKPSWLKQGFSDQEVSAIQWAQIHADAEALCTHRRAEDLVCEAGQEKWNQTYSIDGILGL